MESSRPSATASGGGRQAALISLVSRNRVETAVLGCWVLTLVVICLHAGINPGRHSVFTNYRDAGGRWIRGEYLYLYPYSKQFLYSPLAAALFAPFALLPQALGGILWRLISAIALILGVRMSARMAWPGAGGIRWTAWGLAALLPLSLSDLNNGQAGVLVTAFFAIWDRLLRKWPVANYLGVLRDSHNLQALSDRTRVITRRSLSWQTVMASRPVAGGVIFVNVSTSASFLCFDAVSRVVWSTRAR